MNIVGVPESISREAYVSLIRSLGLDPYQVVSIECHPEGVYTIVFAQDSHGNRQREGEEFAKHEIWIPVVDDAE